MIIQGRVTKVIKREGTSERTGNAWKSVEFIVEFKEYPTDRKYDHIALSTFHEKVIDNIKEDMIVKAVITHKTHEYNDRIYNDIELNEIHVVRNQAQAVGEQYATAASMAGQHDNAPAAANVPTAEPQAEDPDDLPF